MQTITRSLAVLTLSIGSITAHAAATVLFDGRTTTVEEVLPDATELWVSPAVLPAVNGFELKPEGACFEDICVPVRQDEDSNIFVRRGDAAWFNVTELADRLQQPYVTDYDTNTWSFGAIPVSRKSLTARGIAPDFSLPNWQGGETALSDFKGKKIMLLSWASW